ncbi:unnamed protein product, partial [Symbiodinium sp. CCMP2592]
MMRSMLAASALLQLLSAVAGTSTASDDGSAASEFFQYMMASSKNAFSNFGFDSERYDESRFAELIIAQSQGCKFCFPDGLVIRGSRITTERTLADLIGCGFWMRVTCCGLLLTFAGALLLEGWFVVLKKGGVSFVREVRVPSVPTVQQEVHSKSYTIVVKEAIAFQDGSEKESTLEDVYVEDTQGRGRTVLVKQEEVPVRKEHEEESEHVELMATSMYRHLPQVPIRYEEPRLMNYVFDVYKNYEKEYHVTK